MQKNRKRRVQSKAEILGLQDIQQYTCHGDQIGDYAHIQVTSTLTIYRFEVKMYCEYCHSQGFLP